MMPEFFADFHLHSRYSRACSKDLTIAELAKWSKLKGLAVLGTGDFTHPLWMEELTRTLRDTGDGLYEHAGQRFLLTAEVNTLFYVADKCHQIHHLLFVPSLESAARINRELTAFGNLGIDGRPMLKMSAEQMVEVVLGVEPRAAIVPAHVWTPHFGVFGSNTGFDRIEACYGAQTTHIFAMETGLSSDPAMNWRCSANARYTLISNSDSHSARKIGREANRFECALTYDAILAAMKDPRQGFLGTLEFFPEHGKYHLDGHRACQVRLSPAETKQRGGLCPACGRKVTVGVMHRVEALADRPEGFMPEGAPAFTRMVPLDDIISQALDVGVGTKTTAQAYLKLVNHCGTEFNALLEAPAEVLRQAAPDSIVEAILAVRLGQVVVEPGYDGEYGIVRLAEAPAAAAGEQMTFF